LSKSQYESSNLYPTTLIDKHSDHMSHPCITPCIMVHDFENKLVPYKMKYVTHHFFFLFFFLFFFCLSYSIYLSYLGVLYCIFVTIFIYNINKWSYENIIKILKWFQNLNNITHEWSWIWMMTQTFKS